MYRGKDRKNIASGFVTETDTGEKPMIVLVKYATRHYRFHSKQNDSQHGIWEIEHWIWTVGDIIPCLIYKKA